MRRRSFAAAVLAALLACGEAAPPPGPRPDPAPSPEELLAARERMIETQVKRIGATSPSVVGAFRRVPRHLFLPSDRWREAYEDRAVRQPDGETLTAPDLSAAILQVLELAPDSRVLECGTRSGWLTALLATCAGEVFSADARPGSVARARGMLARLGLGNVRLRAGDPLTSWLGRSPFDAIVVNGVLPHVPRTLYEALVPGGRILVPVGVPGEKQTMILCVRGDETPRRTHGLLTVRFGRLAATDRTR